MAEVMTDGQFRQAKKYIAALCANYDKGNCLILDTICPQSLSYTLLCNYFKQAVLPDKECLTLQTEICKIPYGRRCVICGNLLQGGARSKYCSKCAKNIRKAKVAGYVRRHREKLKCNHLGAGNAYPARN